MVLEFDFLDVMAWDVALTAVLLGIGAVALPCNSQKRQVEDTARDLRISFAIATGSAGFYLFLSGVAISFIWPFALTSGVYNVLFGGMATLGGLVTLAGSVALAKNVDLRPVTYFAAVTGIYAIVDAYGMIKYNLTSSPFLSALGYLSFAAPAILSVPAAHFEDRRWRLVFAVFAFLFAAAWLYQAANFTLAHLNPA
jgi:uncharacterized membrane protein